MFLRSQKKEGNNFKKKFTIFRASKEESIFVVPFSIVTWNYVNDSATISSNIMRKLEIGLSL